MCTWIQLNATNSLTKISFNCSAHPESPNFGKHYTVEQVNDIFAPSQESVDSAWHWIEAAGIQMDRISISTNKQWLQFDATVSEAEELLKTSYHVYEHTSGKMTIGCDEYSVPEHIRHHIDYVTPGIKLYASDVENPASGNIAKRSWQSLIAPPAPITIADIKALRKESLFKRCQSVALPECIAAMYKIPKGQTAAHGNHLGVFEDIGDVYSQEDLDLFFENLYSRIPQGTHPHLKAIDGATAPNSVQKAGNESNLDFQSSYPIIYPQKFVLFQTDDTVYQANYTYDGFLNNFLDAIDGSYCQFHVKVKV